MAVPHQQHLRRLVCALFLWQPYYQSNFLNIIVFASFMVITFFMIHNIILGRIFQIYSEKLKDTAIKRYTHRHTNVHCTE